LRLPAPCERQTSAHGYGVIDLVLKKTGERIVVQCMRHARPVGEPVVRDLYGVVLHQNANAGIVCASPGFSSTRFRGHEVSPSRSSTARQSLADCPQEPNN
jgi:hypothetical protein